MTTAERVEAAALRLFATRGFEGTGIRLIADEAGISVASLYHYMGTKDDLLERLMRKSMSRLLEPAAEIVRGTTDVVETMSKLVDLHVRRHAEDNLLSVVSDTEIRSLTSAARREMVALRDGYEQLWEQTVASGVDDRIFSVPDVKLATLALLEMCTGVAYWYSPSGRLSLDTVSKSFVDMALSLLGAKGVTGPPRKAAAKGSRSRGR